MIPKKLKWCQQVANGMPAKVRVKEQLLEKCGLRNDSVSRKLLSEYAVEKVTLRNLINFWAKGG